MYEFVQHPGQLVIGGCGAYHWGWKPKYSVSVACALTTTGWAKTFYQHHVGCTCGFLGKNWNRIEQNLKEIVDRVRAVMTPKDLEESKAAATCASVTQKERKEYNSDQGREFVRNWTKTHLEYTGNRHGKYPDVFTANT